MHVFDPSNFEVYYSEKTSPLGAKLNIDMRSQSNALEIVSFDFTQKPSGKVPGTYRCTVKYFGCQAACRRSVPYTVTILTANNTWQYFPGNFASGTEGTTQSIHSFTVA